MKTKGRQLTTVDLFRVLRRALLLVIACALLGGAAGYYLSSRGAEVTYTASSSVYVQASTVDMEVGQTSNEIALGRALALSCRDAIKNDTLYNNVKDYFAKRADDGWPDISKVNNDSFGTMISAAVETNSQEVTITVVAKDGKLAIHLANAIADELESSVVDIIGACRVEPKKWAYTATPASTFSLTLAFAGALFGAFAAYALMLLLYVFDPRVRDAKELVEQYGEALPLLGEAASFEKKGGHRA